MRRPKKKKRRGSVVVEFALLLPFLILIFVIGADWCRIYYAAHTVQDAARTGALGASGIAYQEHFLTEAQRQHRGTEEALRDSDNLSPKLNPGDVVVVTSDSEVSVTVTYNFETLTQWPGISGPIEIRRTVRMPVLPSSS
ncbi:TadE/TadG family type IV pilus assembly protein [Bremerella sp. P1]|uniref:TadE/TadG family type IV pilus assembly protein n=1 Tax=Bremerella sp. P1 TaxID=3026424 RepID=UPI002368812F|nr:TadE/TadG family type IV pilus assembly protein [Bremerella sp. P1]WDI42132.1 TadE/TadG family type IV pilus assembly protein [Bremerella sp. P1]